MRPKQHNLFLARDVALLRIEVEMAIAKLMAFKKGECWCIPIEDQHSPFCKDVSEYFRTHHFVDDLKEAEQKLRDAAKGP